MTFRRATLPASTTPRVRIATLALGVLLAVVVATGPIAHAQTYTVLHNFSGAADGGNPTGTLAMAGPGNFYGTTQYGGSKGAGTVFNLRQQGSGWILKTLYSFQGGAHDGAQPLAGVTIGPDGSLYGTTSIGGATTQCNRGCGIAYKLTPPARFCNAVSCPWNETVLYFFDNRGNDDGIMPGYGNVVFDHAGNLYGTTIYGGGFLYGSVYELTPSNGGWTETPLWWFLDGENGNFGKYPYSGVVLDSAGNVYGTTAYGGYDSAGNVYKLYSTSNGWEMDQLFYFEGGLQGYGAIGGVVMDAQGNLYGGMSLHGPGGGGTVYELTPTNGNWNYTLVQGLPGSSTGPVDTPTFDSAGNLYLTLQDASGYGSVIELTPSNGVWNMTTLHTFNGNDGAQPYAGVILDNSGNVYGTTALGGSSNNGVIFAITP